MGLEISSENTRREGALKYCLRLILNYPDHDSSVPDFSRMTKRQFISHYLPGRTEEELAYEDDLDEIVPHWFAFEHWVSAHSPDIKAYELLKPLDLGGRSERPRQGLDPFCGWPLPWQQQPLGHNRPVGCQRPAAQAQ